MAALPRLMLVTDRRRTRGRPLVPRVVEAVAGGVGIVQVREKDLTTEELGALVDELRRALPDGTPLIVNGNPLVARQSGSGLHAAAAGALLDLGREAFDCYGRSVHDEAELLRALSDHPDYLVAGTIFATEPTPGMRVAGMRWLEHVCRMTRPTPVYAIGGVSPSRVPALIRAGAHGVAVCRAILGDNQPRRVAQAFALALGVAQRAQAARG